MSRHIFWFELQRIAAACDKVGLYETWSDICNGDGEMTHPCLLRQAFILILSSSMICYRKILTINDAIEINVPTAENHNVVDEPMAEF